MSRSHVTFALRWAAGLGLAATLALPAFPAAAQPETGSGAATPSNCAIQFSVANPSPGNQEIPLSLTMSGTAMDATAKDGTGISRVQAFLGNRDAGGLFIGEAELGQQPVGPPGSWSISAAFPDNVVGGQQLFVYALSSVSGTEAVVNVPVAFGNIPTHLVSDQGQSFCPIVMAPTPPPIASTLVQ
jgi:hypothetical protein